MQKRTFGILLVLCMLLGVLLAMPASAADVIEIITAEQILKLMNGDPAFPLDGNYLVKNNIDLSTYSGSLTQKTIGSHPDTAIFTGTFDGGNYTISGFNLTLTQSMSGFFGAAGRGAVIKNLTVSGSITNEANATGGLLGYGRDTLTIENCVSNVTVSGQARAAGILGGYDAYTENSVLTILNCTNNGDITGSDAETSGIVGRIINNKNFTAEITNCVNTGDIQGTQSVAGIVSNFCPKSNAQFTVSGCANSGKITTTGNNVGGIIANLMTDTAATGVATVSVSNCSNTGAVTTTKSYAGGIVGYAVTRADSTVNFENLLNNGSINGDTGYVGGIVGAAVFKAGGDLTVSNCVNQASGTITGAGFIAGICGRAETAKDGVGSISIMECSNYAAITSKNATSFTFNGGIVGMISANSSPITLSKCYNAGTITGASAAEFCVGGIAGYARSLTTEKCVTISDCWNAGAVTTSSTTNAKTFGFLGGVVGGFPSTNSANGSLTSVVTDCVNTGVVTVAGTGVTAGGVIGGANKADQAGLATAYTKSGDTWTDGNGETVTSFAGLDTDVWVVTANGPELKANHTVHVWEYLNDKQHKCGCGETESHDYEDKVCVGCDFDQPAVELTSNKVVYVKENGGSDASDGSTPDAAFQTLTKAYQALAENGGTIVICDTITLTYDSEVYDLSYTGDPAKNDASVLHAYYAAPQCGGAVKVTSKYGDYDFTNSAVLKLSLYVLRNDHIFDDITIEPATTAGGISALGNDLLIGANVKCNAFGGGPYPMILSSLFEVNVTKLYFDGAVDTIVWKSGQQGWTGTGTNPITTAHYQNLLEGTDGDGVQDIVINGGTWRNIKGGNHRASTSAAYGALNHELNITINGGTIEGCADSLQSGLLQGIFSTANGSSNMTINGGTFNNCAIYLFGRNGVNTVKTIEGNHSLTINGGTFTGYTLIAGAQGKDVNASASSSTSLPTDTTSNLKASGVGTITISGGEFGSNVAVKTTATGDVTDVFTADGAALNLVISADIFADLGARIDMDAFSSRTDYDTNDEYCEANGHSYTNHYCVACGEEQEVTTLTLTALNPKAKTFALSPDATENGVSISFTNVVVEKDGDKWVASGYTLTGGDGYYVLKDSSKTFELTYDGLNDDIMTVTADGQTYEIYYGQTLTLSAPDVADGYRFDGWEDASGNLCVGTDGVIDSVTNSMTLTPKLTWISDEPEPEKSSNSSNVALILALACKNNKKCAVTIKSTGADNHETITVKNGTVLTLPAVPTKDGYTFMGWYKDINGTKPFDFNTKISGNVSIYAKWIKN